MNQPLVSICIPTHNRPELFKQALESALNQTYKNIEIIISDNSSDDLTKKIVNSKKNKNIFYHRNLPDTNSFENGSILLKYVKGKYIKYLYDDDLLKENCVEKMVSILEKYRRVGVVMAPLNIIDENGDPFEPTFYFFKKMRYLYRYLNEDTYVKKEQVMNDFLTKVYPCCVISGIMFRKTLVKSVKGPTKFFDFISDLEMCMKFATKMDFYYLDDFLSSWRYSKTSETVSILHHKGIRLNIFYLLTKKYLHYTNNVRGSYFFASKRTTLNIMAGMRSGNLALIIETIKTILYNDPYLLNKIYLPFELGLEVFKSLLGYEKKR